MWIKIKNKIVNLNNGIYIQLYDNANESIIRLKKIDCNKSIELYESKDKKRVYLVFLKILKQLKENKNK